MILYDRTSPVTWARRGTLTVEQMAEVPQLSQLLSEPSVLFDNGAGVVYDWRLLAVECARYGVEQTGDADADYAALLAAVDQLRPSETEALQAQLDALAGMSE